MVAAHCCPKGCAPVISTFSPGVNGSFVLSLVGFMFCGGGFGLIVAACVTTGVVCFAGGVGSGPRRTLPGAGCCKGGAVSLF